jgi:putative DNA primase/helicase
VTDARAYAAKAVANECSALASAQRGTRNAAINKTAFALGRLAGYVDEETAKAAIFDAAIANGVVAEDGEPATLKSIQSGWKAGAAFPRELVETARDQKASPTGSDNLSASSQDGDVDDGISLASSAPLRIAEELVNAAFRDRDLRVLLRRWRGEWWRFDGHAYVELEDEALRGQVWSFVDRVGVMTKDGPERVEANKNRVSNVVEALSAESIGTLISSAAEPPVWVGDGRRTIPRNRVACRNGLLDPMTGVLEPSSPDVFVVNVADAGWDPNARAPVQWLAFLGQVFENDPQSIELLQEFMGYTLTADTSLQKLMMIVGPKRSGKGTICRIWMRMLGSANICSPSLSSIAERFGLQPFLNKLLAIIPDARLSGRADQACVVERLLSITGEDAQEVDRKHRDSISVKLTARVVLVSNELPRLTDASGAFPSRAMILRTLRSFYGQEDTGLEGRLGGELSGILAWACAGLRRLKERGRFMQPDSSTEALAELEELASPVASFVADRCDIEPEAWVEKMTLYKAWAEWAKEHGLDAGSAPTFSRNLIAAFHPRVRRARPRAAADERKSVFAGITLRRCQPDE